MFEISDLIKELKVKYPQLDEDTIESMARIQFKWIYENIQSAEFKPIKLMYIGKFIPKERAKTYWEEKLNEGTVNSSQRYKRKERREDKEQTTTDQ